MKLCIACGVEFSKKRKDQNSCGNKKCRKKVWKILNRDKVNAWSRQYRHKKALSSLEPKSCNFCKVVFLPNLNNKNQQIYCSGQCRNKHFRKTDLGRQLHNFSSNNRRHRVKANGGNITKQEWSEILELYENRCAKCGNDKKITIDHIIPIALGGIHSKDNIQPLCVSCNSKKHIKTEF